MIIELENMCEWEKRKAIFLLSEAQKLGFNIDDSTYIDLNTAYGNVYIYNENEPYTLVIGVNAELKKTDIFASYFDAETGVETELYLENDTTKQNLNIWVELLESENK